MSDDHTSESTINGVRAFYGLIAFVGLPAAFILLLDGGMNIGKAYGFYLLMCLGAFVAIGVLTWLTSLILKKYPDLCIAPSPLKEEWAVTAVSIGLSGALILGFLWGLKWFCITVWPLAFFMGFCAHGINWAIHQMKYRKLIT